MRYIIVPMKKGGTNEKAVINENRIEKKRITTK